MIKSQKIIAGGNFFLKILQLSPKTMAILFTKSKNVFVDLLKKIYRYVSYGCWYKYIRLELIKSFIAINKGNMTTLNCPKK